MLESLEKHRPTFPLEVLLTLNIAEPDPAADMHLSFPVIVTTNRTRRGFARNHNRAFRRARGKYFCALNPDIVFVEPVFTRLIDRLKAGAGIAAPVVVDPHGEWQDTYRRLPRARRLLTRFRGRGGPDDVVDIGADGLAHPDWIGGTFLLMKADTFRQLDGFDERYFLYYEDADLGIRCRLAGCDLVVDSGVKVVHDARRDSRRRAWFLGRHVRSALRFFLSPPYRKARARIARGAWSLLLIGVGAGGVPGASAQVPRLFDPAREEIVYDLLETAALRGERSIGFPGVKPWSSHDLAELLRAADSIDGGPVRESILDFLREEVRFTAAREAGYAGLAGIEHLVTVEPRAALFAAAGEHELDPPFLPIRRREAEGDPALAAGGSLRLGYAWLPGGLAANLDLRAMTNTRNAFDYRDRDPGGAVDVRSAYLLWQGEHLLAAVGRLPAEWGTGPLGGVGLAATGPSLDGFLARAGWGAAQITILSAFLPDERANRLLAGNGNTIESSMPSEGRRPLVNRYFHGHRLDLRLADSFTLGISEMALVTGVRRRPDLQFLTGLVPYVVAQNSREEIDATDINLAGGVQYRWRLPGRVLLYGEYFANEVFLDTDVSAVLDGLRGRRMNTQGFQQGVRWVAPFGWEAVDLEGEIVRLEPFLYLHRGLNTNWRRQGVPLGAPLGPDNHRAILRALAYGTWGNVLVRGTAGVTWRERGIGRVTDNIDVQALGPPESIPREPVETSWLGSVAAELWWPRRGNAGIRLTGGIVDDANNIVGSDITPIDIELYIRFGPVWDHAF